MLLQIVAKVCHGDSGDAKPTSFSQAKDQVNSLRTTYHVHVQEGCTGAHSLT